ncbi:hypothetical protein SAMN05444278_1312 [Psychroflexus salarius]|uniref:Uncharacterized protein n=1 Tax=Psychroflexus salarius TaxID=1155689 RepID=A0A1M4YGT0_9FLAO|nr:hypothetical protein [Psychroflexus salarius]SHF04941.1 hypothetical protein SAMN05444278_1312 [Psychroflexus salarius]
MITLRLIGSEPYVDPRFLDSTDVPFMLIGIVLLIIAYYKIKNTKPKEHQKEKTNEIESKFELTDYDILMQPKKNFNKSELPFINFSLPTLSRKELILGIILFIFYYLIFTEKI